MLAGKTEHDKNIKNILGLTTNEPVINEDTNTLLNKRQYNKTYDPKSQPHWSDSIGKSLHKLINEPQINSFIKSLLSSALVSKIKRKPKPNKLPITINMSCNSNNRNDGQIGGDNGPNYPPIRRFRSVDRNAFNSDLYNSPDFFNNQYRRGQTDRYPDNSANYDNDRYGREQQYTDYADNYDYDNGYDEEDGDDSDDYDYDEDDEDDEDGNINDRIQNDQVMGLPYAPYNTSAPV
jgi:hypothetical protein